MALISITFPGLNAIQEASYAMRPGISPSAAVVIASNASPGSLTGDLVFAYQKGAGEHASTPASNTITIPDCLVEDVSIVSDQPDLLRVTLLDRRWRWIHGHIDGHYNRQRPEGGLDYEQTPAQLMTLLLDAMGESGYSVAAVTAHDRNSSRPTVYWRGDVPALMLDALCRELGFVVTINSSNNVVICERNVGTPPPTTSGSGTEQNEHLLAVASSRGVAPEYVRVACSNVQYECRLECEMVGLEPDGSVELIDDLSYAPAGGFTALDMDEGFTRVSGTTSVEGESVSHRALAQQTVGRWWRVKKQAHTAANYAPPGYLGTAGDIDDIAMLLPLRPYLNSERTLSDGTRQRREYVVEGVFADSADSHDNYTGPWRHAKSLDRLNGIVQLSRTAFKRGTPDVNNDAANAFTTVYLRCVVEVDDPDLNVKQYYAWTSSQNASGEGIRTIERPEIEFKVTPTYTDFTTLDSTDDNGTEVDAEAEYYADAEAAQYAVTSGFTVVYEGLRTHSLDGMVRQISWTAGSGVVPRTIIAYGVELPDEPVPYEQLQREHWRLARQKMIDNLDKTRTLDVNLPDGVAYV